MATLFDLPLNQNPSDKISSLKIRLYLAELNDSLMDEWPKAVGAVISTNVLMTGRSWKYIDSLVNSINPNTVPGESPLTGVLSLSPILEGISKQNLDWLYKNKGKRFLVIWERCETGERFLGGSPCSGGMLLSFASIGKQENSMDGIALSLTGGECAEPFYFYEGPLVREDPAIATLTAAGTFALTAKSQYLLSDNTEEKTLSNITGVTDSDVGRIIELQGAGLNFPTQIVSSEKFVLKNGLQFSAKIGSSISFQITKTGAGYIFMEVYRA